MSDSAERKLTARTKFYIDTEFIESGPSFPLILLSIGIVEENGRELYLVNADAPLELANDWVRKNVIPYLGPSSTSIREFGAIIREWIGVQRPEFWGYYADYDWVVFCQIFGSMIDLPKGWPMFCRDIKQLCVECGDPELPEQSSTEHNALNDARWNKLAHEFLLASTERREPPAPLISWAKEFIAKHNRIRKKFYRDVEGACPCNECSELKHILERAASVSEPAALFSISEASCIVHDIIEQYQSNLLGGECAAVLLRAIGLKRAASASPVGPEPKLKDQKCDHGMLPEWCDQCTVQQKYEWSKKVWAEVVKSSLFDFLKHQPLGRTIMRLFGQGQISLGKAAESIVEAHELGLSPKLPELKDDGEESIIPTAVGPEPAKE